LPNCTRFNKAGRLGSATSNNETVVRLASVPTVTNWVPMGWM